MKKPDPATSKASWCIYNIGNSKPIKLMKYIDALEKAVGKKAKLNYLPLQRGDVADTSFLQTCSTFIRSFNSNLRLQLLMG